jgi:hypothetical protein
VPELGRCVAAAGAGEAFVGRDWSAGVGWKGGGRDRVVRGAGGLGRRRRRQRGGGGDGAVPEAVLPEAARSAPRDRGPRLR